MWGRREGGRREEGGRTWDGGDHDLAERNALAVEAVDDCGELELVEARRDVANHRDVRA